MGEGTVRKSYSGERGKRGQHDKKKNISIRQDI